jgi:hypothetical protein
MFINKFYAYMSKYSQFYETIPGLPTCSTGSSTSGLCMMGLAGSAAAGSLFCCTTFCVAIGRMTCVAIGATDCITGVTTGATGRITGVATGNTGTGDKGMGAIGTGTGSGAPPKGTKFIPLLGKNTLLKPLGKVTVVLT